ncbi:RIC1-domain-containing protein [Aspergillus pseudotamarii]|uniref:RIC1-domain-containing protein n=1 Tax=Aspergillus pseudotamarii TaxID=132259 RepID=A0A5N6SLB1_ASPPS|nr:RIC1-domain-containing protein [Aspergillus pseudotamarii]KAE8135486.1 RIC1-domain-containing protein [Aspergillus pseudotamarii]
MYWPNGVPRVYAVNGPAIPFVPSDDNEELDLERSVEQRLSLNENGPKEPSKEEVAWADEAIDGLCVSRSGHMFATMTATSIAVWQTRPTAVVAAVARSASSLSTYGPNVALLMHPDSTIIVVQTLKGYLLTYTVATDPHGYVYQQHFDHSTQTRRQQLAREEDANGVRDASIRFRMAIKIESGIVKALALDNELVVATVKPAAIQCIRWTPDAQGAQTTSELLSRILGVSKRTSITEMVYDRAINLLVWVTNEGQAYAVQRVPEGSRDPENPKKLFNGHCFHSPKNDGEKALRVAVNARFSLLTVNCANGDIFVYTAKDYLGNVPLSHKLQLPASPHTTGNLSFMSYSPDGYCLFAGYERGWTTWSVFGKPGGNSFSTDRSLAETNAEDWLTGVSYGCWIGGGSDIILTAQNDRRLWILETARSALTGCFSSANLARGLLQTGTEIILYRGHDLPDLMTISGKDSLWHHAQYPPTYLHSQWPIRSSVVSQDGRYVAIAGRRGLAHYSVNSGRWKVFEDSKMENSFAVRGGMCWYGHILIAAIESDGSYELRLYSRELPLNNQSILHIEYLPSPVVFIGPSGEDSILVYTYDNILYHFIINSMHARITLVPVGQIAFNGIVRAPTRVRAISWVLPEDQMRDGDPSQDVKVASVLLLVDGNLVLLQPSQSPTGDLKYDMRVVSHDVEYYILMRDQLSFNFAPPMEESLPASPSAEMALNMHHHNLSLRDSLWTFCGKDLLAWGDVQDILRREDVPKAIEIPLDFYPLSVLLNKGIALGVESEMTQRRDTTFAVLKFAIRICRARCHSVSISPIFHTSRMRWKSSFTTFWTTKDLFEQALRLDSLKTAVGYLLVLQAFEDDDGYEAPIEDYVVRLLVLASQKGDWELCAELARFLIALDGSGEMLRRAIERTGLRNGGLPGAGLNGSGTSVKGLGLAITPSWSPLSAASSVSPRQSISRQESNTSRTQDRMDSVDEVS